MKTIYEIKYHDIPLGEKFAWVDVFDVRTVLVPVREGRLYCAGCFFKGKGTCGSLPCVADARKDKTNVIFVKEEEQGK